MSLKKLMKEDLSIFFNEDEFGQEVSYYQGSSSTKLFVQFFDEDAETTSSLLRKMIFPETALPNLSTSGYFLIEGVKYGIIDFDLDEQSLLMQVILQKGAIK